MYTKEKGSIGEQLVICECLRRGYHVSIPIGDCLPYDLILDIKGRLLRIQVKTAWANRGSYRVDMRRTKTNRRIMIRSRYIKGDFDFLIVHILETRESFIIPSSIALSYSAMSLGKIGRPGKRSSGVLKFKEAWKRLENLQ